MSKTVIRVGQKWKNYFGDTVIIEDNGTAEHYKFKAVIKSGVWYTVTSSCKYFINNPSRNNKDLCVC